MRFYYYNFLHLWVSLSLGFATAIFIYEIVTRLSKKGGFDEFWEIQKHSTIFEKRSQEGRVPSLLELSLDFIYLITELPGKGWEYLKIIIFSITIFYSLRWLPLLFFITFTISLSILLLFIAQLLIFKSNFAIKVFNWKISSQSALYLTIINFFLFPLNYAFLVIYFALGAKTKPQLLEGLQALSLIVCGGPFWYVKTCILLANILNSVLSEKIWFRKKLRAWPEILYNRVNRGLFNLFEQSYLNLFWKTQGRRIIVENGRIRLNGGAIAELLKREGVTAVFSVYRYPVTVEYFDQEHQALSNGKENSSAAIFTTSLKVLTDVGEVRSIQIEKGNPAQKFLLSYVQNEGLKAEPGHSIKIMGKQQLYDYSQWAGLQIRLGLIYRFWNVDTILLQQGPAKFAVKLEKPVPVREAYGWTNVKSKEDLQTIKITLDNNKWGFPKDNELYANKILKETLEYSNSDLFYTVRNSGIPEATEYLKQLKEDYDKIV